MEGQFGAMPHQKKNFMPYLTKTFWKKHYPSKYFNYSP
jgi:hypothetical protein